MKPRTLSPAGAAEDKTLHAARDDAGPVHAMRKRHGFRAKRHFLSQRRSDRRLGAETVRDGSSMDETDRRIGRVHDDRRLLCLPEVMERTGLSKPTICRLIKAGGFRTSSGVPRDTQRRMSIRSARGWHRRAALGPRTNGGVRTPRRALPSPGNHRNHKANSLRISPISGDAQGQAIPLPFARFVGPGSFRVNEEARRDRRGSRGVIVQTPRPGGTRIRSRRCRLRTPRNRDRTLRPIAPAIGREEGVR